MVADCWTVCEWWPINRSGGSYITAIIGYMFSNPLVDGWWSIGYMHGGSVVKSVVAPVPWVAHCLVTRRLD